jgi:hypothetical protein
MAVEQSVQQMALTRDTGPGGFMERVQAMLAFVTSSILSEPAATPYHQQRAFYAQKVVGQPRQAADMGAPHIVMGVNVVNTTTYNETTQTAICTIADIDLQSQIASLWNTLAGIDTAS